MYTNDEEEKTQYMHVGNEIKGQRLRSLWYTKCTLKSVSFELSHSKHDHIQSHPLDSNLGRKNMHVSSDPTDPIFLLGL